MAIIVLDPGHGGNGKLTSYGATGNGLVEKELVLNIAQKCRQTLTNLYDCQVVLTRDSDVDVSFFDRANIARNAGADLLVSLHFNGYHDSRAHGFESFIFDGTLSQNTINYQHAVHNKIYSALAPFNFSDRGKKRANFAMLRLPPCPCVLPEYAFITNPQNAETIKHPGMIDVLAGQTASGIAEALKLERKIKPPEPLPNIQRRIGVKVNGETTTEEGYLINNGTYVRMAFAMQFAPITVTGHGDHINIKTEVTK